MIRIARLALAASVFAVGTAAATEPVALQCGRLFDARAGRMLDAHTVVVRDGRIERVESGRVDVPGARAVDLSGHSCSPGWTDLHVHLGSQSSPQSYSEGFRLDPVDYAFRSVGYARKTLMAGFTSVRDLGGEEFTVVLPETDGDSARRRAEEIRSAIGAVTVNHLRKTLGPNTASIGIATFPNAGDAPSRLLEVADAALYRAKAQGRDRVVSG